MSARSKRKSIDSRQAGQGQGRSFFKFPISLDTESGDIYCIYEGLVPAKSNAGGGTSFSDSNFSV